MDSTVTDTRQLKRLKVRRSLDYFLEVSSNPTVAKRRFVKHTHLAGLEPEHYHATIVNSKAEYVALLLELKGKRLAAREQLGVSHLRAVPLKVKLKRPTRYEVRHTVTGKHVVWDTRDARIVGIYGTAEQAKEAKRLVGKSFSMEHFEHKKDQKKQKRRMKMTPLEARKAARRVSSKP